MATVAVPYEAAPTLGRFLGSSAFVRCVMGPVGSGKSSACVVEILRRALAQAPGPDGIRRTRFAVIRNTYGQLRDTTRKTFEAWIPPEVGHWNEQQFSFRIKAAGLECEVLFRALDRPEDVKKLLSLDLTGAYVNEAREISKHVFEVLQTRVGRYPSKLHGGPTWFGIWMDTNPWHRGHWAHKLFVKKPEGHELFRQPGGRSAVAENADNLPAGYYSRLCVGKSSDWIRVYVDGEEAASDIGSIYGHQLEGLEGRGGVSHFDHPTDGVFLNFDLGISDATAIWAWRWADGVQVVNYYEASGKPLSHFFEVIRGWRYDIQKIWLPHDARARTLITGSSVLERFVEEFGPGKVAVVPSMSLLDGIEAGRATLEHPKTVFHARCEQGLESLREYRYEWDEDARTFSKKPLHNFASHGADAWRYTSVVVKVTELLTRKPKPEPQKPPARDMGSFTLDELWEMNESRGRRW